MTASGVRVKGVRCDGEGCKIKVCEGEKCGFEAEGCEGLEWGEEVERRKARARVGRWRAKKPCLS